MDPTQFEQRMQHADMASELFYPVGHAVWRDGRFQLKKEEVAAVRTQISGVRFQAADSKREDLAPERQCQSDVVKLVDGVTRLRELPGMEGCVLAKKTLKCRQPNRGEGTRIKFGLECDEKERSVDDVRAAGSCHRSIVKSIRRSGFVIMAPKKFDRDGGMSGLREWGGALLLRRRRPLWPWLLLLLLPLLLLLLKDCSGPESFFGVSIETRSLIVVVDKSSSMQSHFPVVQAEAKNVLERMRVARGKRYANVIAYDGSADSALGGLKEVDEDVSKRLQAYLDALAAGGGTNLKSAIEIAAKEVAAHEQPTTLVILTDGQDGSIQPMLDDLKGTLDLFQGVEIIGNTLTPRLFTTEKVDPKPANDHEKKLDELAQGFKGRFGPDKETQ